MMRITKEMLSPSREDAVRLTRTEKMGMITLAYVATVLEDMQTEMKDRFEMVENGNERLKQASDITDELLNEVRMTIPVNQRMNLQNTAHEFEVRLAPKATPSKTSVVMQKEEFKDLIDFARAKCVDCMMSDTECEKCKLFQALTIHVPLQDYHDGMLCPYNMGVWAD